MCIYLYIYIYIYIYVCIYIYIYIFIMCHCPLRVQGVHGTETRDGDLVVHGATAGWRELAGSSLRGDSHPCGGNFARVFAACLVSGLRKSRTSRPFTRSTRGALGRAHLHPSLPRVGERGGAPKGGRHSTMFCNPQRELCLSSAHLCSGSLMF